MAVQQTPRLGLNTFSSGADFHPTREDFNQRMGTLDDLVGIALQGPHAARPLPATRGRLWWSEDLRELYWDTGSTWEVVAPLGGTGGAPAVNVVGVGGSTVGLEGESRRAARADHAHALPLASATSHGAMSSTDKALLNSASPSNVSNSLVQRNATGHASMPDPTSDTHIATKRYVDVQRDSRAPSSHTHNASDINAGVLAAARLPAATQSTQGAQSAEHKALLDNASTTAVTGSLVRRSEEGSANFQDPVQALNVANKRYVDLQRDTRAPLNHTHSADHVTSGVLGVDRIPNIPGERITSGTVAAERLPAATGSTQGAMPAADKAKLDGATHNSVAPGRIIQRDDNGNAAILDPLVPTHIANRRYVDATALANRDIALFRGDLGTRDLNTVEVGNWGQGTGARATSALNYPVENTGGTLEVRHWSSDPLHVTQTYITRGGGSQHMFIRSNGGGAWTPWYEVVLAGGAAITAAQVPQIPASRIDSGTVDPARLPAATRTVQGAILGSDKAKLDDATPASTGNTLVQRNAAGQFAVPEPSSTVHPTPRSYVDAGISALDIKALVDRGVTNDSPDTITTPGIYTATSGAPAGINGPGALIVIPNSQSTLQQWIDRISRRMFLRRASAGVWTDWIELANTGYVDTQVATRAALSHNHAASQINSGVLAAARLPAASQSAQGALSAVDKTKLDSASSKFGSGGTLVLRDADGRANFASPVDNPQAANKEYVDTQVATRAALAHTHSADDVNSGTLAPERLPAATQEAQGAQSAEHKTLLDNATHQATGDTLVRRLSSGAFFAADPESTGHVATRGWTESNMVQSHGNVGTTSLNTIITPGTYNADDGNATTGRGYPVANSGGSLTVLNTGAGHRKQIFDRRSTDARYTRRNNGNLSTTWTDWSMVYS